MKLTNSKGRVYSISRAKLQEIATWCHGVKPTSIRVGNSTLKAYGDSNKSNYIYISGLKAPHPTTGLLVEWAYCLWLKADPKGMELLKEKGLKVVGGEAKPKAKEKSQGLSASKAGVKPEAKKAPRGLKVIKPTGEVINVPAAN